MSKEIKSAQLKGFQRLAPEDMSVHMLISEISKISHNKVRQSSNIQNLPSGYRHLLFHLAHNDGVSQLELSRLTHLSPPTVSITLRKMEKDGYILRKTYENDMRQTIVYLSKKGRAFDDNIKKSFDLINEQTVQGLSSEEISALKKLLIKVRNNFQDKE